MAASRRPPRSTASGSPLRERSDYPWSGDVEIAIDPETPIAFDLKLRAPGWAKGATATVNGQPVALGVERGYATIHRTWMKGDVVALHLPMPAERLHAHPRVRMDVGRVALRRGPLIYCVEEADNAGCAVQSLTLPRAAALKAERRADLFDGVVTLVADGRRLAPGDAEAALYTTTPPRSRRIG